VTALATALPNRAAPDGWALAKRIGFGLTGVVLGSVFLWLALRGINWDEVAVAISRLSYAWLVTAIFIYLSSIAVRCVRWGILLRARAHVKWRHSSEALIAGYAANYILPARMGELFRADYARRLFHMSRFTSLGTILVERVCRPLSSVLPWSALSGRVTLTLPGSAYRFS
jgi:glycosyltransferase 2 family protein